MYGAYHRIIKAKLVSLLRWVGSRTNRYEPVFYYLIPQTLGKEIQCVGGVNKMREGILME